LRPGHRDWVVVGDTADEIRAAVGDGSRFGLRSNTSSAEAAGLAHAVQTARDFLGARTL